MYFQYSLRFKCSAVRILRVPSIEMLSRYIDFFEYIGKLSINESLSESVLSRSWLTTPGPGGPRCDPGESENRVAPASRRPTAQEWNSGRFAGGGRDCSAQSAPTS